MPGAEQGTLEPLPVRAMNIASPAGSHSSLYTSQCAGAFAPLSDLGFRIGRPMKKKKKKRAKGRPPRGTTRGCGQRPRGVLQRVMQPMSEGCNIASLAWRRPCRCAVESGSSRKSQLNGGAGEVSVRGLGAMDRDSAPPSHLLLKGGNEANRQKRRWDEPFLEPMAPTGTGPST